MTLMSSKARHEVEELARRMEYMELAETENYERIFTRKHDFPEYPKAVNTSGRVHGRQIKEIRRWSMMS